MPRPSHVATWPSLAQLPALYPDGRNRDNRGPFLYCAGKTWPLRSHPRTDGRIPILAVGSNGYPRQLHDKLAGTSADLQGIPTIPTIIRDLDVAYCPVRSRKGYIPVTLAERPGAVCLTWLQWLTPQQLNIISATEGSRYSLVGGHALAARATIQPRLRRPMSIYAWWFESVWEQDGSIVWLDVHRRNMSLVAEPASARPNVIPGDWRVVPRAPGSFNIEQENMSEL
jgi:hypothetical protein